MNRFDVVIIGAGPAGAACAYWLAQAHYRVALIEKSTFPREKTCGDGLTPRAIRQLYAMGLESKLAHYQHSMGLRSHAFGDNLTLDWPDIGGFPQFGMVIERAELDTIVMQHARTTGATIFEGHEVVAVDFTDGHLTSVTCKRKSDGEYCEFNGQYFVLADGTKGRVGAMLGTKRDRSYPLGIAIRGHFRTQQETDGRMESYLDIRDAQGRALPAYGWVFPMTPTNSGNGDAGGDATSINEGHRKDEGTLERRLNVGVGLLSTAKQWKHVNTTTLMRDFVKQVGPQWGITMDDLCSALRGGKLPTGFSVSPRIAGNYVCVGDAAGAINPFNGEGISYAFETGRLAAWAIGQALSTDDSAHLKNYETELERRYASYYRFARIFVRLVGYPQVMHSCVRIGMKSPPIMKVVLRVMSNLFRPARTFPQVTNNPHQA